MNKVVKNYLELDIAGKILSTPYFINKSGIYFGRMMEDVGIDKDQIKKVFDIYKSHKYPYGWYLGKGTPEQIRRAVFECASYYEFDLKGAKVEQIRSFMYMCGIGVDCSGFVYNCLKEKIDFPLDIYKTSVTTMHETAKMIQIEDLLDHDLIFIKDESGNYFHVAIVLEEDGGFVVVQSASTTIPDGVIKNKLSVIKGKFVIEDSILMNRKWNSWYKDSLLKFGRLT